jgi:hypothetical protein
MKEARRREKKRSKEAESEESRKWAERKKTFKEGPQKILYVQMGSQKKPS